MKLFCSSLSAFLNNHKSFIICGHKNPDGDCISSSIGVSFRRYRLHSRAMESAPPENALPQPKDAQIVVASSRLDALVAAVYRLSRSESQALFERELVFVNSLPARSPGFDAKPGDLISVRGHGRFYFDGIDRETKKGRLRANVRVF